MRCLNPCFPAEVDFWNGGGLVGGALVLESPDLPSDVCLVIGETEESLLPWIVETSFLGEGASEDITINVSRSVTTGECAGSHFQQKEN